MLRLFSCLHPELTSERKWLGRAACTVLLLRVKLCWLQGISWLKEYLCQHLSILIKHNWTELVFATRFFFLKKFGLFNSSSISVISILFSFLFINIYKSQSHLVSNLLHFPLFFIFFPLFLLCFISVYFYCICLSLYLFYYTLRLLDALTLWLTYGTVQSLACA